MSYRRCGRNLRAKLYTVINSLSANHAYLKTIYATSGQEMDQACSLMPAEPRVEHRKGNVHST